MRHARRLRRTGAQREFEQRVIRHEELAKKFKAEFPHYEQDKKPMTTAVAEFERDCAGHFTVTISTHQSKLGLK